MWPDMWLAESYPWRTIFTEQLKTIWQWDLPPLCKPLCFPVSWCNKKHHWIFDYRHPSPKWSEGGALLDLLPKVLVFHWANLKTLLFLCPNCNLPRLALNEIRWNVYRTSNFPIFLVVELSSGCPPGDVGCPPGEALGNLKQNVETLGKNAGFSRRCFLSWESKGTPPMPPPPRK